MSNEESVRAFCVELFRKVDTNGDGVIDFGEFRASRSELSEEEAKVQFHLIDENHDGQISFDGKFIYPKRFKISKDRLNFFFF